ncbi:MBOAT, membrane-bound O-acyltransferase family-domain-containing protein [Russula earlei]|uniref:MBOAT, membrane-bound O-acyltransferase family-domain-containing protein n=1 Tax=Russula earlei TaxID=71964 RepID=A0ACC0U2U5_9AGAM|nr:MBOAT, membrane-bound O-acyltransferase family-domain-containing protein [Russula earlei]
MLSTPAASVLAVEAVDLKIPLKASDAAAVSTVTGDVLSTKHTGTYILKPFRSPKSKKLKTAVVFVPRLSHFDIENERSNKNEFRGFFPLFWISIFIWTVRTYIRSMETQGAPLNLQFATLLSRDARTLALSDAVLVLSTAVCVPFAKLVSRGWIKYYWTGVIIQHLLQTFILFAAIKWTFNRQWPWVQSGFLTLHTLTMLMKMHSYMATNGYLRHVSQQSAEVLAQLRHATSRFGGWDKAMSDAKIRRDDLEHETETESTSAGSPSPFGTFALRNGGLSTPYVEMPSAVALRNRLMRVSEEGMSSETVLDDDKPKNTTSHLLVNHPDPQISALATEYSELESELVSSGPERVRWPENITFKNFAMYQLFPTLVYELEYPRTKRIRPLYVFEKTAATFGTFALLYTVTETFILPYTNPSPEQSFARTLLDLALPFMLAYLLLFFIIFGAFGRDSSSTTCSALTKSLECICNGFAELSYFADRGFYEDWWNSTSWDEFSRKWNKPVHNFLLRHVYASTISSYKFSRSRAMFVTFLLSAAAHELVMAVVTQKIRLYLFTLQLVQIPLIAVGRTSAIKRNRLLGNSIFWLGLYAGFPLLCVAYVFY